MGQRGGWKGTGRDGTSGPRGAERGQDKRATKPAVRRAWGSRLHEAGEGAHSCTRGEEEASGAAHYAVVFSADMTKARGCECRRGREGGQGPGGGCGSRWLW